MSSTGEGRAMVRAVDWQEYETCTRCWGTGEFVVCIDDLCYGQDECIHGDPPMPCPECGGTGEFATEPVEGPQPMSEGECR